jgi:NAD(P)-dependent dehydrogenase (short-subunit alcohol dehydrogenase family)
MQDTSPIADYAAAFRLNGRRVVVIGAGQGIGRQAACGAAVLGAKVACIDVDPERAEAVAGESGGLAITGDATRGPEMERMLEEARQGLGGLDAVIDIIGMARYGPILEMPDEDWDFQHDITLRQAFYALKYGGRILKAQGGGAIAFVSSVSANSAPGHAGYGAFKAGLNSLVRAAAVELGRDQIRVNAAAPGLTATPRIGGAMTQEARETAAASIPLGRLGQPSNIASVLLFLISDLAAQVTGQILAVDGGSTATFPIKMGTLR